MSRITMSLNDDQMFILEKIAESMNKRPGDVAKEIVTETLDSMALIFGSDVDSSDVAARRMFKMAFGKMLSTIDDLDKGK